MERNAQRRYQTEVVSLWDEAARHKAAKLIAQGLPVGVYTRGVCAIWGDGSNPTFSESVARIKGEDRIGKPIAASLLSQALVKYLDATKIPRCLHPIFLQGEELVNRTGSLCLLRLPLTQEAANRLPSALVSEEHGTHFIQNWEAQGHKAISLLVGKMIKLGVSYPGVTSMNISGKAEIVNQQEGVAFSRERGIPLFLLDPRDRGKVCGSYTILGVDPRGVQLIREGNIRGSLFERLLGTSLDMSKAVKAKYAQLEFPQTLLAGLNPKEARIAILSFFHGYQREKVREHLLHSLVLDCPEAFPVH